LLDPPNVDSKGFDRRGAENFSRKLCGRSAEALQYGQLQFAPTPALDTGSEAIITEEDLPSTVAQLEEVKGLPFQELIGCLWWLAQMALQKAFHWVSKPSAKLWRWLVRILKYLSGTKEFGIVYQRDPNALPLSAMLMLLSLTTQVFSSLAVTFFHRCEVLCERDIIAGWYVHWLSTTVGYTTVLIADSNSG